MKKTNKILALLLLAGTAACTNVPVLVDREIEDIVMNESEKEQPIEFATFADRTTRAVPTVNDLEFYHPTFKVYATKTSNEGTKIQPIFQGVTVTAAISADAETPNTWEYEIDRYWDKQADNYQFVAFAPAHAPLGYQHNLVEVNDETASFFSTSDLTIKGQNLQEGAPAVAEKNAGFTGTEGTDCDVMRSAPFAVTDPATTPVVTLNFSHTLAKLLVSVKANAAAPYVITINKVTVGNLSCTGTYDHTEGWVAKGTSTVDYLFTAPSTALSATDKTYFIESLLMPQNVDAAQVVTLNYTITSGTYSEEFVYTATLADLFRDKAARFKGGSSYSIHFNIAPEKNIITFDAGITEWEEEKTDVSLD